jgi:hypothetical protein
MALLRQSRELTRAGLIAGFLALCVAYVLWPLISAGGNVVPGRDAVNQYYWELFTRFSFAEGRLPHWNPYHFAGFPHLSDPQTTVFYPPAMLLRPLPPAPFLLAMAALHIWWGGLGALFLARVLRLPWPAAGAAAMAAMLGGSTGPWLQNGHLVLLYTASWLPWAFALSMISARRQTLLPHPALVVVMAMLFLAGYPQTALYVGAAIGLYFLYASLGPEHSGSRATPLLQLTILALLSAGVTAFQLLPTAGLVGEAARTGGLDYRDALKGAWTFRDLTRAFFPFQGLADDPPHRLMSDATIYVGWALTCLVPFAFLDRGRRRVVVFLAIVTGLALALALGDEVGVYRLHYALFPGLRVPGRALFVVTLALAILGAIGLTRFADAAARRDWSTLAGGAAPAALAVGVSIATASLQTTGGVLPMHGSPWLPVALVAGVVIAGATAAPAGARATATLVVLLVTIDLLGFVRRAPAIVKVTGAETIEQWIGPDIPGRVVSMCENEVASGDLLATRRPTLDGLGGFALAGYADWAYLVKTGEPPPRDGLYRRISNEGGFPARRDLLNAGHVSTVLACGDLAERGLTLVTQESRVRAYRNEEVWPRAVWTCAPERVSHAEAVDRLVAGRYLAGGRLVQVHYVNIRWAPHTTDEQRTAAAARYDLLEGVRHDQTTWRYILANTGEANVRSLLRDPLIEDTHGIDRVAGTTIERRTARTSGARDELLVGTAPCPSVGTVAGQEDDGSGGGFAATVDSASAGYVFVSDAFYPERQALVDGQRVTAQRANLAFTAIPVPAGRHRIELRYVPTRFYAGIAISVATVVGWLGAAWIARSRHKWAL